MKAPTFNLDASGVLVIAGLAALGVAAAWVWSRGGLANAGQALASGAADLAGGAVVGLGRAVGVPATDATECDRALAEGRTWAASFACPAGRFLGSLARPETVDQGILDANDARARAGTGAGTSSTTWDYRPLDPNDSSTWAAP